MGLVVPIKGAREAPKAFQSRMETLIISVDEVRHWQVPKCQRPLRVNPKVVLIAETLKTTECIEGVLTLGKLPGDPTIYIVDGQHRLEAFKLSGLQEVIADIRMINFESMIELALEFVRINSVIVKMRPDDILRGLEDIIPALAAIRGACPFVSYGNVRRAGNSDDPVLSMSVVVRCWTGSAGETPSSGASTSSAVTAENIEAGSLQSLILFLNTAEAAWGRDPEYYRLWGALNLTLCMWMWRRLVIDRDRAGNKKVVLLNINEFKECLMAVSANGDYLAWLPGRAMSDRDRSPCYVRLKAIIARRLKTKMFDGGKLMLPQPAWSSR